MPCVLPQESRTPFLLGDLRSFRAHFFRIPPNSGTQELTARLAAELGNQTHFQTGADHYVGEYKQCVSMADFITAHRGFLGPLCVKGPPSPPSPPSPPLPSPPPPPLTPGLLSGVYVARDERLQLLVAGAAHGLETTASLPPPRDLPPS